MKRFTTLSLLTVLNLTLFLGHTGQSNAQAPSDEHSKIQIGYAIAPVPLDLKGKNRGLVGLGSYIVNGAGTCSGCHTSPPFVEGGDPFLGQPTQVNASNYLSGGTAFGPFVSRNLTPNRLGRPAGFTLAQFIEVIRTGKDLKNIAPPVPSPEVNLLQVMPWPEYREMSDRDLTAIYEYLTAIPCIGSATRCTP